MPHNPCVNQVLQAGDTGPCVRYLQELLQRRSGYNGAVDGVMGDGTCQALRYFQHKSGLEPTGKTEPVTWEMLTTGDVPATPPPRQRCRLLRIGAEGPDVAMLQEQLGLLGFGSGVSDGIYGPATAQAVIQWQRAVGLPANGIIGRRAWEKLGISCDQFDEQEQGALAAPLRLGDQGRSVVVLQALLLAAGFDPGPIDGIYGSLTAAAIGSMQKARGLPVSQRVDSRVWTALGISSDAKSAEVGPTARLRYGSRGKKVRDLQLRLLEAGFEPGQLDGVFGYQVRDAVLELQAALNIPPTGTMGWAEWRALGVTGETDQPAVSMTQSLRPLCPGERGPEVEVLQQALAGIGFDPGPLDGSFGPLTEAAVMLLQRSAGLPVTGVADELTWNALT